MPNKNNAATIRLLGAGFLFQFLLTLFLDLVHRFLMFIFNEPD